MRMRMLGMWFALLLAAPAAQATVIARVVAPLLPQQVGTQYTVFVEADLQDPVLGWGPT